VSGGHGADGKLGRNAAVVLCVEIIDMAERYAVHILIGVVPIQGGTAYGVVFRDGEGRTLRQMARRSAQADPRGTALTAILRALWSARRLGRTVRVAVDQPEVVEWLNRRVEVDEQFLTPFVQIRALTHSYRLVEVVEATEEERQAARAVAQMAALLAHEASRSEEEISLPLWSAAS
jgi:signal transduction histidine kinase